MPLDLSKYMGGGAGGAAGGAGGAAGGLAAASPWGAAINGVTQLGTAALNDKTNMTNDAALSQWFTFGDKNVTIGGGSIGTSRVEPMAAAGGSVMGLLQNPLVLVLVALVAYKVIKS